MPRGFSPNMVLRRTEIGSPFPVHLVRYVCPDELDPDELYSVGECANEDREECADLLRAFGIDAQAWVLPLDPPEEDAAHKEPHYGFWSACGGPQSGFRGFVGAGFSVALWFPDIRTVLWRALCNKGPKGWTSFTDLFGQLREFDPSTGSWSDALLACRLAILGPEIRPEDCIPLSSLTPEQVDKVFRHLTDTTLKPGWQNGRKSRVTLFLASLRRHDTGPRWTTLEDMAHEPQDLLPLFRDIAARDCGNPGPKVNRRHLQSRVAELRVLCQACTGHNKTWAKLERIAQRLPTTSGITSHTERDGGPIGQG